MSATRRLALVTVGLILALATLPGPAQGSNDGAWYVIRFDHRLSQTDRDALERSGAEGIQYLPEQSYLAFMSGSAATDAEALGRVEALTPADKIDEILPDARFLTVSVFGGVRDEALAAIGASVEVLSDHAVPGTELRDVIVQAPPSLAPVLARLPQVVYVGPAPVGPVPLDELSAQIQAGASPLEPGYEDFLERHGLTGQGVRLAIVDTGVDEHPDLAGRIVDHIDYEVTGQGEPVDVLGHGTHVAGIAAADAKGVPPPVGPFTDPDGFQYGLGVAPEAEIVDQAALSLLASGALCNVIWPPSYPWTRLTTDALANGASVWNASWWTCENSNGDYIATARTYDALARDADPDTPGPQPFTFVFAAGNFGPREQSIGSPGAAKNLITVGATNNARGTNPETQPGFTSRGPLADGRIGPLVSAPGANIVSTKSFDGGGLCFGPAGTNPEGLMGSALYSSCSGTSMAAPHVTGAVGLATEWWRKANDGADPSPAMTRALLVNSAHDMAVPNIPNNIEGWGRVNVGTLFDAETERITLDQSVLLTELDDTITSTVRPADPSRPLKVSLAWSDAPGAAGAAPALVNDLDLLVTSADGTTFRGNVLIEGVSVAGGEHDRLHNIENVFLPDPEGTYTVTVTATGLPGDGDPFRGDQTDQDFALVISNAVAVESE